MDESNKTPDLVAQIYMTQGKFANLNEAQKQTLTLLRRADKKCFLRRYRSDNISQAWKLMDHTISPIAFVNSSHVDKLINERFLELLPRNESCDFDYVTIT
jgi:hypothetical protein